MDAFEIIVPDTIKYPIVLSLPHIGTAFPEKISKQIKSELLPPDDTDWDLDQLYAFATELGIPVIKSVYSRWVIDLNRKPDGTPLYNDGRVITHACTTTDFNGNGIYMDERKLVAPEDVAERKRLYYDSYHDALQGLLNKVRTNFGVVLLWDGHSIRRNVPSISAAPFPDFIVGTNDGNAAPQALSALVGKQFQSNYHIEYNTLFKGGNITRHYGQPAKNQFVIQLEMSKDLYMKDNETCYDIQRAAPIQAQLKTLFIELGAALLKGF